MKSLLSCLSEVKDPRRKQGLRISLDQLFGMVVISYLCGYTGYRAVSRFCKSYEGLFREELGLRHAVPSFVTFRQVLMNVNEKELIKAFNEWTSGFVPLEQEEVLSGDGKSLRSTVTNYPDSNQDFQSVVSFFSHRTGMVARIAAFRNKKKSEIEVLLDLIKTLKMSGLVIRLDALHAQKNG